MTELDFDELDKAVNTIMTQKPTTDDTSTPASDTLADPSPVVAQQEAPSVLATKRRGQFMDVMHPSSDMTTKSTSASLPSSPSRQGVSLQPTGASLTTDQSVNDKKPAESPAASTPADDVSVSDSDTTEMTMPDWPDPIDAMEQQAAKQAMGTESSVAATDSSESQEASEAPAPAAMSSASMTETDPEPAIEPLASPFLPDTKVEKRPLGAALPTGDNIVATPPSTDASPTPSVDSKKLTDLPAELQDDIIGVEADTTASGVSSASEAKTSADDVVEHDGPTAIAPQYKPKPAGDDAEHAALYDNVAHDVVHPAKKKSGIWVVLIVLILIALGVGGGYFAYQYHLFM